MLNNKLIILFVSLSIFICGCSHKKDPTQIQEKFDKIKWSTKEGKQFPYRDAMLKDLVAIDTIKKLNWNGVVDLLGQPSRSDTNFLFYTVSQELMAGVFPLHTRSLVIKFNKDSTVLWVKTHE